MVEILYTVKDLAPMTALSDDPEMINRVMRQIRHWTNMDVLRPFGPKSTGTGVSRVYDTHGARKSAILVELSRYGVTVEMLWGFDEWCDEAADTEDWQKACEGHGPFYICVTWDPIERGPGNWMVLSDDELFAMVTGDPESAFKNDLDPEILTASSLIVINLTTVFARIRSLDDVDS